MEEKNNRELFEEQSTMGKIKARIKSAAETAWDGTKKCCKWIKDNKEDVAIIATTIVGARKILKEVIPEKTKKEREFEDRQLYYYDRKHDLYLYLRRELKMSEKIELSRRVDCGENAADVLRSMKVLKY